MSWDAPEFRQLHHRVTRLEDRVAEAIRDGEARDQVLQEIRRELTWINRWLVALLGGLVIDLSLRIMGG